MKVKEAIEWADEVKPNAFSSAVKTKWLSSLEGRLCTGVFLMARTAVERVSELTWPESAEWELLVAPPYDDIYPLWLQAKIDEANGEYNKYANSMAIYNEHYGSFVRWFAQTYDPAQGYRKRQKE